MDSERDEREPPPAREADARLGARVRRASLLWWAAAGVALCLLNFTMDPQKAWLTDLAIYAGASFAGFGWSLLVARRLSRARRRMRREAVWEGLGFAVLGGCVCGAVAGVFNVYAAEYLKLHMSIVEWLTVFTGCIGNYVELCVGWCFIYFGITGAERLARIEEEVSSLRVISYNSHNELLSSEIRNSFVRNIFEELSGFLLLRRQSEAQEVVLAVAAKLRGALDRWRDAVASADPADANLEETRRGDAEIGASELVVSAMTSLNIVNILFWIAIFVFFVVTTEPYYVAARGVRGGWSCFVCWFAFCVTGCIACVALKSVSAVFLERRWWVKCACAAAFSVVAAYISACFPFAVWLAIARRLTDTQPFFSFAFNFGCAYFAWYCIYFYAQAVRRELAQRAVLTQAAEAAAAARNSMLRYQVRPHFLFNALNALYVLIADHRWAAAGAMTQALSQYFERSFAEDERELVPIGEQVTSLQAYLGIEKIRFGDRLRFRADIPEPLAGACAPSLILHPLVENAMKYAVAATSDPVDVEIVADRIGDTLLLCVRDSGGDPQAPAAPGFGIGLRNVAARLAGHYGERGLLRCERLAPKGFVAEIRLPLDFARTRVAA